MRFPLFLFLWASLGLAEDAVSPVVVSHAVKAAKIRAEAIAIEKEVPGLIEDLGSRSFATREKATKKLFNYGRKVIPHLRKALEKREMNPEGTRRANSLIAAAVVGWHRVGQLMVEDMDKEPQLLCTLTDRMVDRLSDQDVELLSADKPAEDKVLNVYANAFASLGFRVETKKSKSNQVGSEHASRLNIYDGDVSYEFVPESRHFKFSRRYPQSESPYPLKGSKISELVSAHFRRQVDLVEFPSGDGANKEFSPLKYKVEIHGGVGRHAYEAFYEAPDPKDSKKSFGFAAEVVVMSYLRHYFPAQDQKIFNDIGVQLLHEKKKLVAHNRMGRPYPISGFFLNNDGKHPVALTRLL